MRYDLWRASTALNLQSNLIIKNFNLIISVKRNAKNSENKSQDVPR